MRKVDGREETKKAKGVLYGTISSLSETAVHLVESVAHCLPSDDRLCEKLKVTVKHPFQCLFVNSCTCCGDLIFIFITGKACLFLFLSLTRNVFQCSTFELRR